MVVTVYFVIPLYSLRLHNGSLKLPLLSLIAMVIAKMAVVNVK